MCSYREFLSKKNGEELDLYQGPFSPETVYCKKCSINDNKDIEIIINPFPSSKSLTKKEKISLKEEILAEWWERIIQHVKDHQINGEEIHPAVIKYLQSEQLNDWFRNTHIHFLDLKEK